MASNNIQLLTTEWVERQAETDQCTSD